MAANYDLRYLAAGVENLESYLLSADLYWPPGIQSRPGETPYPSLTPGNLLLARKKAEIRLDNTPEQFELVQCCGQFDILVNQWRSAWGKKIEQDFRARLRLWRDFIEEFRQKPEANLDRFPYEITRRVQLQLLKINSTHLPSDELEMLSFLDKWLYGNFIPGQFIWDPDLSDGFPVDDYWFLYGVLIERE